MAKKKISISILKVKWYERDKMGKKLSIFNFLVYVTTYL